MSDVANILGVKQNSTADSVVAVLTASSKKASKLKPSKPPGMARELFMLVGSEGSIVAPTTKAVIPLYKNKRLAIAKGKWIWMPFSNSGRRFVFLLCIYNFSAIKYRFKV